MRSQIPTGGVGVGVLVGAGVGVLVGVGVGVLVGPGVGALVGVGVAVDSKVPVGVSAGMSVDVGVPVGVGGWVGASVGVLVGAGVAVAVGSRDGTVGSLAISGSESSHPGCGHHQEDQQSPNDAQSRNPGSLSYRRSYGSQRSISLCSTHISDSSCGTHPVRSLPTM